MGHLLLASIRPLWEKPRLVVTSLSLARHGGTAQSCLPNKWSAMLLLFYHTCYTTDIIIASLCTSCLEAPGWEACLWLPRREAGAGGFSVPSSKKKPYLPTYLHPSSPPVYPRISCFSSRPPTRRTRHARSRFSLSPPCPPRAGAIIYFPLPRLPALSEDILPSLPGSPALHRGLGLGLGGVPSAHSLLCPPRQTHRLPSPAQPNPEPPRHQDGTTTTTSTTLPSACFSPDPGGKPAAPRRHRPPPAAHGAGRAGAGSTRLPSPSASLLQGQPRLPPGATRPGTGLSPRPKRGCRPAGPPQRHPPVRRLPAKESAGLEEEEEEDKERRPSSRRPYLTNQRRRRRRAEYDSLPPSRL